jgi:acyl phosphate:glycerol-3-phosphate acyltransferase
MLPTLITILIAYLVGSVPFGYLIVRLKHGSDVRETGSGGTGATNVSRSAGKLAGVVTLTLDAFKGIAATLVARLVARAWGIEGAAAEQLIAFVAIAVVVGHIFPVWLKFRGGKGVATAIGVFLLLAPIATLASFVAFFQAVLITRYVSFGSMLLVFTVPLMVWIFYDSKWLLVTTVCIAALVLFAHRANIVRLINGTETKFR